MMFNFDETGFPIGVNRASADWLTRAGRCPMIVPFITLALLLAFSGFGNARWRLGDWSGVSHPCPAQMVIAIGLPAMNLIRFRRLLRPTLIVVAASANIELN